MTITSPKGTNKNPWFTSDTHFGHARILEFEKGLRPFKDLDEMNEQLVHNWNEVVKPDDKIIHLGDFSLGGPTVFHSILPRLNGRITLVGGNHDTRKLSEYVDYFERVVGAWEIGQKIIATHIPVHTSQLEERWNLNIHGHLHSHIIENEVVTYWNGHPNISKEPDTRYYNAGVDLNNLKPISLCEILSNIDKIKS